MHKIKMNLRWSTVTVQCICLVCYCCRQLETTFFLFFKQRKKITRNVKILAEAAWKQENKSENYRNFDHCFVIQILVLLTLHSPSWDKIMTLGPKEIVHLSSAEWSKAWWKRWYMVSWIPKRDDRVWKRCYCKYVWRVWCQ